MKAKNVAQIEKETTEIVEVSVKAVPAIKALANPTAIQKLEKFIQPNIEAALAVTVKDADTRESAFFWARTLHPFVTKLDDARKAINRAVKTEVDGRFQPVIDRIKEAENKAMKEVYDFDEVEAEKAREAQRKADEERKKAEAELARRKAIQDAAVAAGKEAKKEIPTIVERVEIAPPAVIAEDKRTHYRLRYEVVNVNLLPEGLYTRTANRAAINRRVLVVEDTIPKERKGMEDIQQNIPGVRMFWEREYRKG